MNVAKKSLRACRAGQIRLAVERLEDRVIPGETLNAILFWQLGLFPIRDIIGIPCVADVGETLASDRTDRQANARTLMRADDEGWIVRLPLAALSADGETASESSRPQGTGEDVAGPSNGVTANSAVWSIDVTETASPRVPAQDSPDAARAGAAVSSPAVWGPPAVGGESTASGTMGPEVGPIAAESAIQVAPAAADAGAVPLLHAQPAANPHGGGSPAGYTPAQVRHAYGFDQLANDGAGQTIAIVDAYDAPNIVSDLDTFSQQFSLPTTTSGLFTFSKVFAQGSKPKADGGWAQETSLDVEWAHAIAPRANIMLVEAAS